MSSESNSWVLREELKKSTSGCTALSRMLRRKFPDAVTPCFSAHDEIVSATRYWGCRVKATLTVVRKKDNKEKTLSFCRDWRDDAVPLHVEPLVLPESDSLVFSPVTESGFDFSKMSELARSISYCTALEKALDNFFNWAAKKLSHRSAIGGFVGEVRVERFKIADRFVYRHNGEECEIWANRDTDEVWEKVPEIGVAERKFCAMKALGSFLLPYLVCATVLWWLSVIMNAITAPPITPEIIFGLCCMVALACVGIFMRGIVAKLVGVVGAFVCAKLLIPWIGEAWDMTSEIALLSPFVTGELSQAPVAAVYVAGSLVLTLFAILSAPSLAMRFGSFRGQVAMAVLLAAATSPWPKAIAGMPDVSAQAFRVALIAFCVVSVGIVGQCGWVLSRVPERDFGADGILAWIARITRPSTWVTAIFVAVEVFLIWNKLCLMGGVP